MRYPIAAHTIPSINTTFHRTCWGGQARVRDFGIGSSSRLPPGLCSHLRYVRFQICYFETMPSHRPNQLDQRLTDLFDFLFSDSIEEW
jgi:hypothetical protein